MLALTLVRTDTHARARTYARSHTHTHTHTHKRRGGRVKGQEPAETGEEQEKRSSNGEIGTRIKEFPLRKRIGSQES